jgi:hypothetical protein
MSSSADLPVDDLIRVLLVRRLRADGLRALCRNSSSDFTVGANRMSQFLVSSILLSLTIYGGVVTPLGALSTALGIGLALLIMATLIATRRSSPSVAYVFVALWIGAALHLAVTGQWSTLSMTHVAPFAIVLAAIVSVRALLWVGKVPFVVPVGFIIVLAPLLTEDPWRLASAAGTRLLILAPVACLPLFVLAATSIFRVEPMLELADANAEFGSQVQPERTAAKALLRVAETAERKRVSVDLVAERLKASYMEDYRYGQICDLNEAFKRFLRVRALGRLIMLVLGSGIISFLLIYVLAWAAMPISLASDWAKVDQIPVASLTFFDIAVVTPLGPYLAVPSLFTIVTVAGLLAFSATEEKYSTAIKSAVLRERAVRLLLIGLPFLYLSQDSELRPINESR